MTFGNRLKQARESLDWSRIELAEKLGITKSAISNYENGVSSPKEDVLLKIFDIMGVEPNFLFQDSFFENFTLNPKEIKIITNYRQLNDEGQEKSEEYIDDLVSTGRYKKDYEYEVEQKQA